MPRLPRASKSKAIASIKKMFKKRKYNKKVNVNRALAPFAQRYITKMKYCEAISISSTGPQVYKWNLNSVFDPNRSGVGHQPYGHDQLTPIYNRYRVISCSYVISGVDTAGRYIQIATLPANEEATISSLSVSEIRENPRARYITQAPNASLKMLKGYVNLPSLTGRNKAEYMADDRYSAAAGNSPQELMVLNVFAQDLADGLNTINTSLNLTLTYTVEWFDPKQLGQS